MRKSKLSLHQIAKILKEFDSGKSSAEITWDQYISLVVFYKWHPKYVEINSKVASYFRIKNNNFDNIRKLSSSKLGKTTIFSVLA